MPAGSDSMSQPSRLSFVRVGIWLRMVKVPSFLVSAWQCAKLRSERDGSFSNPSGSELIFHCLRLSEVRVLILTMVSRASSWFRLSQSAMSRSVNFSSPKPSESKGSEIS